jgi:hypothetical protein
MKFFLSETKQYDIFYLILAEHLKQAQGTLVEKHCSKERKDTTSKYVTGKRFLAVIFRS